MDAIAAEQLGSHLCARLGRPVTVTGITHLSAGWESDIYTLTTTGLPGEAVLRGYFGADAADKAREEAAALAALADWGYPAPALYWVEPGGEPWGRPYLIMARVPGQTLGAVWRSGDSADQARATAQFCELLARLHALEWRRSAHAARLPVLGVDAQLATWARLVTPFGLAMAAPALDWLTAQRNRVTHEALGPVHWDFHHENVLLAGEDAWVIDWTQLQVTDVRFDLAWTLLILATEGRADKEAAVREGYAAARGWSPAAVTEELAWFEAAACAKRLLVVMVALRHGSAALGMRPGAEAVIRGRLGSLAQVYRRWLALTGVALVEAEAELAAQ